MNQNMERWVLASLATHLASRIETAVQPITLHVEGQASPPDADDMVLDLRLDGFSCLKLSTVLDRYVFSIQVTSKVKVGGDIYAVQRVNGLVRQWLSECILVREHGDGMAEVGHLSLDRDVDGTKQLFTINGGWFDESMTMYVSKTIANYTISKDA